MNRISHIRSFSILLSLFLLCVQSTNVHSDDIKMYKFEVPHFRSPCENFQLSKQKIVQWWKEIIAIEQQLNFFPKPNILESFQSEHERTRLEKKYHKYIASFNEKLEQLRYLSNSCVQYLKSIKQLTTPWQTKS